MYQCVVVAAEETEVVEICGATIGPVFDVVGVTPAGTPATTGHDAVTVPGDQSSACCRRDDPRLTAHINYLGLSVPDDPTD